MSKFLLCSALFISVIATLLVRPASAEGNSDRVQIGRSIVVQSGEKTGDLVCIACSILVRGETGGDVVVIAGNVTIEQGAQVAGDTVAVFGNVRIQPDAQAGGDVVAVAGTVRRDPQAKVGGEITSLGGAGWMLLIAVIPLLVLGGIVALIIWLVQRSRRTALAASYPGGTASTRS